MGLARAAYYTRVSSVRARRVDFDNLSRPAKLEDILPYIAVSWMPSDDYLPEFQRFTVTRIYRYILGLMERTRIDLSPIITHHFPIARVKDAWDLVVSKDKSVLGVVFEW